MVKWEIVIRPRKLGGLGVRVAHEQNIAWLGKLVWELLNPSNQLWTSVLKGKYFQEGNLFFARNKKKKKRLVVWNSIMKALEFLKEGFQMKIGEGNLDFWNDSWVTKKLLAV